MKSLSFELRAVPPFRLDLTAWVLRRQPHNTVDRWDGTSWRRVLVIDDDPLEAAVTQIGTSEQPRLHVTLSGCRISEHAKQYASSLLRQMFGLGIDLSVDRVPPIPRSTLAAPPTSAWIIASLPFRSSILNVDRSAKNESNIPTESTSVIRTCELRRA
jgi:hypothetical protein